MKWVEVLRILDGLIERRSRAPQYSERVAALRQHLGAHHVSPEIIDRIIRLNPELREGASLRGWNYKRFREPGINLDCISKGRFLQRFGRSAYESLPASAFMKRGRRVYVTALGAAGASR